MRIENRMQLSYGEKSVRKSGRKKTAVFWSVEEQDVWQVVQIKYMPV